MNWEFKQIAGKQLGKEKNFDIFKHISRAPITKGFEYAILTVRNNLRFFYFYS